MSRKLLVIISIISISAFNSSAFCANVSTLLEKGIYAEETKGDLDEAISIYQKIIDENTGNSANIAEAYYRLGTCYLKKGDETKAIEMFKELLTGFREPEEIVLDARDQLIKLNALDEGEQIVSYLKLDPVPWESGETCYYIVKTHTGMEIGDFIVNVKETAVKGNDIWRIDYYMAGGIEDSQVYPQGFIFSRTDILKESFLPVSVIMRITTAGENIDSKTIYEDDNIKSDLDLLNNKIQKDIPLDGIVYDNEQVWYLLRRLPIKENYNASFSIFNGLELKLAKENIKTLGRETVTVPAGTFDCYCIELEFQPPGKAILWISVDEKKYIVKYDGPTSWYELESVGHKSTADIVGFADEEFGVSLSSSNGWQFIESRLRTPFKLHLFILPPELKTNALFQFIIKNYNGEALNGILDYEVSQIKSLFKNLQERPDSRKPSVIGGLNALSFTADYEDKGKKMVEYRKYIAGEDLIYVYMVRSEKEEFGKYKQEYDSIIQSLVFDK